MRTQQARIVLPIALLLASLGSGGLIAAASDSAVAQSAQSVEFFENKIRPILAEQCYACHSSKAKAVQGRLRLDQRALALKGGPRGPILTPEKPEESLIIRAISYQDHTLQMPPKGRLAEAEISLLREWVKRGAPWPEERVGRGDEGKRGSKDLTTRRPNVTTPHGDLNFWSFRPLAKTPLPAVKDNAWIRSPIDRFILAKLEAKGIKPSPPADRRTLIRRLTFDLIGLPPTQEEVEAFVADWSPDAFEKVTDRLLASPHYGERWARHWLDLVRYSETDGHEFDTDKPGAYEYRDYVIRALNADVPYNQFVMENVAGDLLPKPRLHPTERVNESIIGTGFWWFGEAEHSPVDVRQNESERFANQIDVFSKCFLGLSVGCARCHDHKFDPISTKEYYGLAGYMRSSRYDLAAVDPADDRSTRAAQIAEISTRIDPAVIQIASRAIEKRADNLPIEFRKYIRPPTGADQTSVFHAIAVLADLPVSEFSKRKAELAHNLHSAAMDDDKAAMGRSVYVDFSTNGYRGWFVSGDAFGVGPAAVLDPRIDFHPPYRVTSIAAAGAADSGWTAYRLQGELRSQTFTIEKPWILYHMAGRDTQANLIIDGFQRIRDPIYGGLTTKLATGDRFAWYAQDVSKWIGHRAYIEFVDHGGGYLAVDRILFSSTAARPFRPNGIVLRLLDDPAVISFEDLLNGYARTAHESSELWRKGDLLASADRADLIELLNGLLSVDSPALSVLVSEVPDGELLRDLRRRSELEAGISAPRRVMALADGTGEDLRVNLRGSYRTLGDPAPRRPLAVCGSGIESALPRGSGRLELAGRLVSPSNPLLSRVIVNRVWQHHFGEGIVRSPDDFGFMGQRPTHPELLEWLAAEFSGSNGVREYWNKGKTNTPWSLKRLHRLIVLSSAYQMSSRPDMRADAADPQNKLLHKMPVRRLEAECIRDSILAVSGRLDRKMFGPSVPPHLTPFMEGRGRPDSSGPLDGAGRRSIYVGVRRNFLTPMFLAFDYPVPFTCMGRRSVSNVPSQALTLMNDPFVVEQAAIWAKKAMDEPNLTAARRIERLYAAAFSRPPDRGELNSALDFLKDQERRGSNDLHAWSDLCHVLYNVKEFIFVN